MVPQKVLKFIFLILTRDLYGQNIQVDIIESIRDEHKFNSLEELKTQF